MSVLLNSKDGALTQAFAAEDASGKTNSVNQGFIELQRTLVAFIRGLPGNDKCCDCGSNNGKKLSIQMPTSCVEEVKKWSLCVHF